MSDVIRAETQSVLRFLGNSTFGLDYYQREFVWTEDHVDEFLGDLQTHLRYWEAPENVLPWFIGTVMLHQREGETYLVDGQQRTATILCLLLALRARMSKGSMRDDVDLALGVRGDRIHTPLSEPRYRDVFRRRFADPRARDKDWDESQHRLAAAHDLIALRLASWPDVTDWNDIAYGLLHRTIVSRLLIRYDDLVHEVFVGINARGARLSQLDQLKNALLHKLPAKERSDIAAGWNQALRGFSGRHDDRRLAAFSAASIARYAPPEAFAAGKPGAGALRVEAEPPLNWLAYEGERPANAAAVGRELPFYVRVYDGLAALCDAPDDGLEAPHFLTTSGFLLRDWAPVVLAALDGHARNPDDNIRRAAATLAFLDIAGARAAWRPGGGSARNFRRLLLQLVPNLRQRDVSVLVERLVGALQTQFPTGFDVHKELRVTKGGMPPRIARAFLNRLTALAETWTDAAETGYAFLSESGPGGFALENLAPPADARGVRRPQVAGDDLGAFVLVPHGIAQELRADASPRRFARLKSARNALTRLLSDAALGDHTLWRSVDARQLRLGGYTGPLDDRDIAERTVAYARMAAEVWAPERIREAASRPDPRLTAVLGLEPREMRASA